MEPEAPDGPAYLSRRLAWRDDILQTQVQPNQKIKGYFASNNHFYFEEVESIPADVNRLLSSISQSRAFLPQGDIESTPPGGSLPAISFVS